MKAKLIFTLPEELPEFDLARHGADFMLVINDLDNELRAHLKYDKNPEWDSKTVEKIRSIIWEIAESRGVAEVLNG